MLRTRSRSTKFAAFLLIMALLATLLTGCGQAKETTSTAKLIKIASVSPLSGSQSAIGEDIKLGAQMAFDEKKAELEKLGFTVEFAPQDDQADPKMGVTVAQKLIADKSYLAVVGHFNSGVAIPSSEIYNKGSLCMVSPGTTNPDVTDRKLPTVNRVCARDDVQGPMGADFVLNDIGAKSVFIIHDKTTYGQGIAQEFQKRAEKIGLKVLGFEGITAGESDFSGVLNKISSLNPDAVYFGGIYPEGSLLIRQMNEKGIKAKFMGPDGMDNAEVVKIAGNASIGTYYSSPAADIARTPEGKEWVDRFKAKYNKEPGNWSAYGYDSMTVIIAGIKDAIEKNDGKLPTRTQVSETIRATKDLQGITSVVTFDDKGDNIGAKLYISEFKAAQYPAEVVKEIAAKDFK
ncbi:MAG TPA: branched-chain amino acid ABC transporter substrate-binding protein [Syntrophomonas sp.]|nr:branched-chain amino acid ABC transporter substrate-binding protein [Syntrophomonas sp.]